MGSRTFGGRYRALKVLGEGGMGTVYLCEHVLLGRRFAVKALRPERAREDELRERFRNEARAASRIVQANVIDVLDFGEEPDGTLWYAMEALEGRSLGQLVRDEGPLPVPRALALLEQVCRALAAAHARGVVHRDVKPENVFVERGPDGLELAKVIDFGISHVPGDGRVTRHGEIIGTPEYMAPEQAAGEEVDARADVYAAGVLAYELLTAELPLSGPTAVATLVAHQTQVPVRPGARSPGIPAEVDALVLRALAKRPADRYGSMLAFAAEVMRVRAALADAPRGSSAPTLRWEPPVRAASPPATVALTPVPRAEARALAPPGPATPALPVARPGASVLAGGRGLAVAVALALVLGAGLSAWALLRPAPPLPVPAVAAPSAPAASPPAPAAPAPAPAPATAEPAPRTEPVAEPPPRPILVEPARPKASARPRAPEVKDPYAEERDTLKPDPFK